MVRFYNCQVDKSGKFPLHIMTWILHLELVYHFARQKKKKKTRVNVTPFETHWTYVLKPFLNKEAVRLMGGFQSFRISAATSTGALQISPGPGKLGVVSVYVITQTP